MYHEMPRGARFWAVLFAIDEDLAEKARNEPCACGGRLHVANYPRKPRGPDHLPDSYATRLSFCCSREGCRKRATPPSVRFLGPKVYVAVVVVLVPTLRQGPTPRAARELERRFGADRRTIARWQRFWHEQFPQTEFWKTERSRMVPFVELVEMPRSMVLAFLPNGGAQHKGWIDLLRFLSPITVPGGLAVKIR